MKDVIRKKLKLQTSEKSCFGYMIVGKVTDEDAFIPFFEEYIPGRASVGFENSVVRTVF